MTTNIHTLLSVHYKIHTSHTMWQCLPLPSNWHTNTAHDTHLTHNAPPPLTIPTHKINTGYRGWVLLYVHRNCRLIRERSQRRPPWLTHLLSSVPNTVHLLLYRVMLTHVVMPRDENRAIWFSKLMPPTPMTSIWSAGLLRVLSAKEQTNNINTCKAHWQPDIYLSWPATHTTYIQL